MLRPAFHSLTFALCLVSTLAMLASCKTNSRADLRFNSRLYRSPGYTSKLPGDRSVFIAPLADTRDRSALPASDGAFPIIYDPEGRWERPLREMVEDILVDELRDSKVFEAVLRRPRSDALVVTPSLERLHSANMETVAGARSLAEVSIRLQVWGLADGAGQRSLLLDKAFADRQLSQVAMAPVSTYHLTGRAVFQVMARLVEHLDSSNVARSGMPMPATDQLTGR